MQFSDPSVGCTFFCFSEVSQGKLRVEETGNDSTELVGSPRGKGKDSWVAVGGLVTRVVFLSDIFRLCSDHGDL